jgi:3-hydroxybutyryl-CoA dehydrogenase
MDLKSVAVIGAGETGRKVAHAAMRAGYRTILEDVSDIRLKQGLSWIHQALDRAVRGGELTDQSSAEVRSNLSTASTVEDAIREADLIVETLPAETEMKLEMFIIFDKFAKPGAMLASITGPLSVTELAETTFCADRCIGVRFAEPVESHGSMRLVRGRQTSEDTVAKYSEAGRRMGKSIEIASEAGGEAICGLSNGSPRER